MRTLILWLSILGFASLTHAQRYLTNVFPALDSTIGGVYGNAVNVQSVNQDLLFDFYAPKNDTETARPLIIYIHGGGFTSGSRSYPSVKAICRIMAGKGYAVANIDYRLDPSFDIYNSTSDRRAMTDAMHDAKQAIRFFKANAALYKLDTNRFFIGGESAGAATAMMATFVDKQSEMGAYPMANPNDPVGSTANAGYSNDVKATMCLCGLLLDTLAMETSADPPILWTHGTDDTFVPISLAFNIVLRAAHVGIPIQARVYQDGVHCPWYFGNPGWAAYLDSTITDITTFLYPQVATPNSISASEGPKIIQKIYPNPANDLINIELSAAHPSLHVSLYSQHGKLLYSKKIVQSSQLSVPLDNLPTGIYWLKIRVGEQEVAKKIVKVGE